MLEVAFLSPLNEVCFWLLVVATGLTVCYTFRFFFYSLVSDFNLSAESGVSDGNPVMTWPMLLLGGGSVFGGAALAWLIFPAPYMICLPMSMKLLALLVSGVGALVGYLLNIMAVNYSLKSLRYYSLVVFSGSMWFLPLISTWGVSLSVLKVGKFYSGVGDMGWSEFYLHMAQDNSVKIYMILLVIMLWLVTLMVFMQG